MKLGELFRQSRPEVPMECTGERMVTGRPGKTEAEHYHRYFLAREFSRGKDVLDIASGEGYGSAFLAQTARRVIGIDFDLGSVEHSTREYQSENLRFLQGDATKLPIENHSCDVVVSFETIEHFSDHEAFLAEVKRVLRADGFLIISTPDMNVYSAAGTAANPFHVREMTEDQFRSQLALMFRNVSIVRQRAFAGSMILPDTIEPKQDGPRIYEQRDSNTFESDQRLLRAPFLIAVASDRELPHIGVSAFLQGENLTADIPADIKAELQRLRSIEETARQQAPVIAKALSDASALPALEAELARLRKVEEMAREQITQLQDLREESRVLTEERDHARVDSETLQRQLNTSALLARQQSLTALRAQKEAEQQALAVQEAEKQLLSAKEEAEKQLLSAKQEAEQQALAAQDAEKQLLSAKEEAERYKSAYNRAAELIIPLRLRKLLPAPLKRVLRTLKHAGQ